MRSALTLLLLEMKNYKPGIEKTIIPLLFYSVQVQWSMDEAKVAASVLVVQHIIQEQNNTLLHCGVTNVTPMYEMYGNIWKAHQNANRTVLASYIHDFSIASCRPKRQPKKFADVSSGLACHLTSNQNTSFIGDPRQFWLAKKSRNLEQISHAKSSNYLIQSRKKSAATVFISNTVQ